MTTNDLSAGALDLFLAYARDAADWSGTPLVGGNVRQTPVENGYLTDLKKRGLLTTFKSDGLAWISFTDAGRALAAEHGVTLD